jgi:hypothetical protein
MTKIKQTIVISLLLVGCLAVVKPAQALTYQELLDYFHQPQVLGATTNGLVGYWNFDEGSGTVANDSSGNENNGTLVNDPTWTTGKIGSGALSFNGSSYVVKNSFSGDFTNGGTISFWTFNNSLTDNHAWISTSQILPSVFASGGKIRAMVYNPAGASAFDAAGSAVPLGQWVFYAVVWDSSVLKIYKNGSNVDGQDTTITGTMRTSAGDLWIGADRGSRSIDGAMDEVRIYNRALSAQEVLDIYNNTTSDPPPSDNQAPTIPANLLATAISSSHINLNWTASTDNIGLTGYKVYRNGSQIGTAVSTSYSDSNLLPSTSYSYTVSAYDAAGNNSAQSALTNATTLPTGPHSYYIDFVSGSDSSNGTSKATPWKWAPGMNGFNGTYSHNAGDQFIFRGGTQCGSLGLPCFGASGYWQITNSGTSGQPDYYGVDRTWYSGSSWSPPVIDGGSLNPVAHTPYVKVAGSYVTMDGLQIQNLGIAGYNQGNVAIEVSDTNHDITVKNMVIAPEARVGIYWYNRGTGSSASNFVFDGNDISKVSWGIGGGTYSASGVVSGLIIRNNHFHDFHDQMTNSAHGDSVFLYSSPTGSDTINSPLIYNNWADGDFSNYYPLVPSAPTLTTVAGSAPVAGAYKVQTSCAYTGTEGQPSAQTSITTLSPNLSVQVSAVSASACNAGAIGWDAYFSNSSGSGTYKQNSTPIAFDTPWVQSSVVNTTGTNWTGQDLAGQVTPSTGMGAFVRITEVSGTGYMFNNRLLQHVGQFSDTLTLIGNINSTKPTLYFLNNTLYGDGSSNGFNFGIESGFSSGLADHVYVENNLFVGGSTGTVWNSYASSIVDTMVQNYNGFYGLTHMTASGHSSSLKIYNTIASLQADGYETGPGISSNPNFISGSDLHLAGNSPAIGAGTNFTSLNIAALNVDVDGNPRPGSGKWDIGAYEYTGTIPPPSDTTPPAAPTGVSVN